MPTLKLGEYTPVAQIEHHDTGNIVKMIDYTVTPNLDWYTLPSNCEHCKSNRARSKTYILADKQNNTIQVGSTCVDEFTGITSLDVIKSYMSLTATLSTVPEAPQGYKPKNYIPTVEYLENCINSIDCTGYEKDRTKYGSYTRHSNPTKAPAIIDYFKNLDTTDSFLLNIKNALAQEFSKVSGFIAYAPIAYKKLLSTPTTPAQVPSEYIGNIGDKVTLEVTYEKCIVFETMYGTQRIYIFKHENNLITWKTSTHKNFPDAFTLTGTVKDHTVYNEQKQTNLLRVKAL
jgi:hypothetical protein